jgi:tetratricopeptide (TPR) repeat protein
MSESNPDEDNSGSTDQQPENRLLWGSIAGGIILVATLLVMMIINSTRMAPGVAIPEPASPTGPGAMPGMPTNTTNPAVGNSAAARPEMIPSRMPKGYENVLAVKLDRIRPRFEVEGALWSELLVQGVLIAAADEMRLATLDTAIGEVIPAGEEAPGPVTVQVRTQRKSGHSVDGVQFPGKLEFWLQLHRTTTGSNHKWVAAKMVLPTENWLDPLVEKIEEMSRTKYVEGLELIQFSKSDARGKGKVKPIEGLKHRLDAVAQFAWVRHIRSQIHSEGETPEALGELVRAYANLGNLTDFQWSSSSKAYKARALLYARRLQAKYGATPYSLAHGAYANALSGRHAAALNIIATARDATGTAAPEWLDLIDAYCSYRPADLEQAQGVHEELALYLRLRMLDLQRDSTRSLQTIQRFLKLNPACCRASEMLAESRELGVRRMVTEGGFDAMWPDIYQRLSEVPDLPHAALKIANAESKTNGGNPLREHKQRMEMMSHLNQAAGIHDTAGPSWAALADILRDVSFVQTWRTLDVRATALGLSAADVDETVLQLKPLVQGHRFERFIDSYSSTSGASFNTLIRSLDRRTLDLSTLPMAYHAIGKLGEKTGIGVGMDIVSNADEIYEDIVRMRGWSYDSGRSLSPISPLWPRAIAEAIMSNWSSVESRAKEFEEKYAEFPEVLQALARQYQHQYRSEDAIRCLTKCIEAAPTYDAYRSLASYYLVLGDKENWQKTLEQSLKLPSLGLSQAQVHNILAHGFMKKGEWVQARPHAIAAASSYSAWGLRTASRLAEGMEDWLTAEEFARAESERYETGVEIWYFWCFRTGRGDMQAARELAEAYWESTPEAVLNLNRVVAHVIDGKVSETLPVLRQLYNLNVDANQAFLALAAVLADSSGDSEVRDGLIGELIPTLRRYSPFPELMDMFQGVISGDPNRRWDPLAFELLVTQSSGSGPWLYLLAGKFLENHDEKTLSQEYLQSAATIYNTFELPCILAAHFLQTKKITYGKARLNDVTDALAPLIELLRKAEFARESGQFDEAETILADMLKRREDFLPAILERGKLHEAQENYEEAIKDYEEALQIDPHLLIAINKLSILYSTCPEDQIRNGQKAMEYAERAVALREFQNDLTLSSLAAAHAELGEFDKAVEYERRACVLHKYSYTDRLQAYTAKQPYRMKSKTGARQLQPE